MKLDVLVKMIERAYVLGSQVQNDEVDPGLAEQVTSECAEFLRVWERDWGAFESMDIVDQDILEAIEALKSITPV